MTDRKSFDTDGLPSIVASPDDPVGGQRREARRAIPETVPRGDGRPATSPASSGPGIGIIVILGLIIVGGGGLGYVLAQQLQLANTQLAAATDRIRKLEAQLSVTGSTLNETSEKAAERIRSGENAMSKLADNLNRTRTVTDENRRLIVRVDAALKALTQGVQGIDATVAAQGKSLAQHQALLARAGENLREVTTTNRELQDKINAAEQSVRAVRVGVERRVTANEQAISAIDAYRKQTNRTLAGLVADVAAMKGGKAEK